MAYFLGFAPFAYMEPLRASFSQFIWFNMVLCRKRRSVGIGKEMNKNVSIVDRINSKNDSKDHLNKKARMMTMKRTDFTSWTVKNNLSRSDRLELDPGQRRSRDGFTRIITPAHMSAFCPELEWRGT
jgi:hypothetical protein